MNQTIDVQSIVEQIRRDIKEQGTDQQKLSFRDPAVKLNGFEAVQDYLDVLIRAREVHTQSRFIPETGFKGKIKNLIRKVGRRLTIPCVEPMVEEQNEINRNLVLCLAAMSEELQSQREKIRELEKQHDQNRVC